jgi:hypothetical protein
MAACRSAIERKTPWRMRCRVVLEMKFSTALRQEAEVGVKWKSSADGETATPALWGAKFSYIVGLYLDPPAHAVVLSLDEKSQIQALDRTQPGLPIKPGRCQTMTHDYKQHGTTTLFAALSVLDGSVIRRRMQRHRHLEFTRFLNAVEREVPAGKPI